MARSHTRVSPCDFKCLEKAIYTEHISATDHESSKAYGEGRQRRYRSPAYTGSFRVVPTRTSHRSGGSCRQRCQATCSQKDQCRSGTCKDRKRLSSGLSPVSSNTVTRRESHVTLSTGEGRKRPGGPATSVTPLSCVTEIPHIPWGTELSSGLTAIT